jgi:hypothetical protein
MAYRRSVVSAAAALVCAAIMGCANEEVEPIPAPELLFPADGATFVPDTLTLQFNDTTGSPSHAVQVSTASGFSSLTVNEVTAEQHLAITTPLANNTTFYWHVNASEGGRTSPWSAAFSFTTGVPAPTLSNPAEGAICVPGTLTLMWNPIAGATRYYVQVSTDAAFSAYVVNDSSVSASFAVTSPLAGNTLHYWRVSVLKPQGASAWSTARQFTTAQRPAAPTPVSPADGAGNVSVPAALAWNSSSGGTDMYHVQVSTSSDFSSLAADADWLSDTTTTVSSLSSGTLYYWRVAAKNVVCAVDGDWSAAWSFTTQ